MKRGIAFMLAVVLALGMVNVSFADVDLSSVRNSEIYTIDINDDGNAFINSIAPLIGDTTFKHAQSLEDHASYVYSDIIVIDYFGSSPRAVWRMWIEYNAPRYLGITSATLTLDGTEYTFTGMGGKDHMTSYDGYVNESPCIIFGSENMMFWMMLLLKWEGLEDKTEMFDMSIPMVLHGTSDVETEISGYAMADMCLIGEALLQITGMDGLSDTSGTSMEYVWPESTETPAEENTDEPVSP